MPDPVLQMLTMLQYASLETQHVHRHILKHGHVGGLQTSETL